MTQLDINEWREVFQDQIQEEKPNHAWSLKVDQQLGNPEPGWKQVLQEHAHARFLCSKCHHFWYSHQVGVLFLIRFDRFEHQGWVRMRVFKQQCDKCSSGKYEEPQFTKMDVSRIIQRLIFDIKKKCYGEHVDCSKFPGEIWGHTGPHNHQHCEACKLGIHKSYHGEAKSTGSWETVACFGCFCLIVMLMFIAYLSEQQRG